MYGNPSCGVIVIAALLASPVLAQAASPSYDCAKARGEVESLICADEGLAGLDRRMAEVFGKALERWPTAEVANQRAFQRGWIKGRNDCWKSDEVRACVDSAYRTRLVEIQIQSGQLSAPTPVGYACDDGDEKPFFVAFYRQTDPPSAVITYGDAQLIALLAPSGSGAKYTAGNVMFWEHHGEAAVDWFGTKLVCRARAGAAIGQRRPMSATRSATEDFRTLCGVIVGGDTYRYLCDVTNQHHDSRVVETTLRYPDIEFQLLWEGAHRVRMRSEGAVPFVGRYSTYEGETNIVVEDGSDQKVYFYVSDKDAAAREVGNVGP